MAAGRFFISIYKLAACYESYAGTFGRLAAVYGPYGGAGDGLPKTRASGRTRGVAPSMVHIIFSPGNKVFPPATKIEVYEEIRHGKETEHSDYLGR